MPLLVQPIAPQTPPVVVTPPATTRYISLRYTSPSGEQIGLSDPSTGPGVHTLAGIDGLGAAPRALTLQPLATGGTFARWSHVEQRLITLPLHMQADTNPDLVAMKRRLTLAFLATAPGAGVPVSGTLRVTRSDGTWREIGCLYSDGLGGADEGTISPFIDRAVVQLVCPDPWWYGESSVAADFSAALTARNYLNPYETLSTGRTLGDVSVDIAGDAAVSPVWELHGPATSVTIRYEPSGPGFTYGAISAGSTITVDTQNYTVTDNLGVSRIGNIAWPSSTLFQMRPGPNSLLVSIQGGVTGTSSVRLSYRPRWEAA